MTDAEVIRISDKFEVGDGCWGWTAATVHNGYGVFWKDKRMQYAHRIIYEWLGGPIPDGLEIDHLCRNRACVRPGHLEAVTRHENIRRGYAARPRRTHCHKGHPYAKHEFRDTRGHRQCRVCANERSRRYQARKRGKGDI